jgi:predicted transcriptional regulator
MEVHFPPDVQEKLVHSAAKQGRDADELVQEVLTRYLADEARFFEAVDSLTDEDRQAAMAHIEEGFLQAERGELINGAQACREIEGMKNHWRQARSQER